MSPFYCRNATQAYLLRNVIHLSGTVVGVITAVFSKTYILLVRLCCYMNK